LGLERPDYALSLLLNCKNSDKIKELWFSDDENVVRDLKMKAGIPYES